MRAQASKWTIVGAMTAAIACVPASAGAATFGADLGNAPNNTVTCGQGVAPFVMGTASCMYFSGAPGPSPYAPQSGTVTAVRVRVGPVTGPMQIVVLRSLYQNKLGDPGHPYFACCFVERYGPVFEPQANAVTTVQTSLPMTEEPTPAPDDFTTNAAGDFLALSVLSPNVPVPMFLDGQSGDSGFYPAPTPQTVTAPAQNPIFQTADFIAGQVLINADLDTGGGVAGGGGGNGNGNGNGGGQTAIPAITFPKRTFPVKGNAIGVPIQCLVVNCAGTLALQNAQQAGLARLAGKKTTTVSYGSAGFSIKAGKTATVKVKLNAAGRKLVKRHKNTKVWVNGRFSAGGGKPLSVRVTLKD
ncbi:MAG: hypothetical protein ACRDK4_03205 [Solirubrobacteraceae bacterium]